MPVAKQGEIFRLNETYFIQTADDPQTSKYGIVFYREGHDIPSCVIYDTKAERDTEWNKINSALQRLEKEKH